METKERFGNRVDHYVKYRPHYPEALYSYLLEKSLIHEKSVIADIGCGTGISSELFLKHGHTVFGIEPNENMLNAAKTYLQNNTLFIPILSGAENTTLENNSVDLIICAQAFHWFNKEKCKTEFKRILKPTGNVVLVWNDRKTDSTDFLKVYEDFLQMFGTDYKEVNHKNTQQKEILEKFFGGKFEETSMLNSQVLDWDGLKGRVLSSSYMPDEDHADFSHMIYCLQKIFKRYAENEKVQMDYDTKVYYGKLK
jgi:SAM-dependent methyltransferase